jgi:hypothetical protein
VSLDVLSFAHFSDIAVDAAITSVGGHGKRCWVNHQTNGPIGWHVLENYT